MQGFLFLNRGENQQGIAVAVVVGALVIAATVNIVAFAG